MMATGIAIGTGIAPTLITVTSLFLSTASGGDFIPGITILTTLTIITRTITTVTRMITTAPIRTTIMLTPATLFQVNMATAL